MTESRVVLSPGVAAMLMELGALGFIAAGATIPWALQRLVETRGGDAPGDRAVSLTALGVSVPAIVVDRLIEYR